jgi:hypothetical protein
MISTYDKCLFVHIPKTAGQSVETVFLERAGLSWAQREAFLLKPNSNPLKGPPRLAHLTAQEYLDYGYISNQDFVQFHKFTVVRNPWDRLVSEYLYQRYPYSFKDFVFKHFPKLGQDDYQNHHGHYRHVMPQHHFLFNEQGEFLVDSVIKFENLEPEFGQVSNAITGLTLNLPHKNKTATSSILANIKKAVTSIKTNGMKTKSYREFYDSETDDWLAEFYAKDIELFNY